MAYLPVEDFGNPGVVSAYARDQISGGEFVFASGAADVVNISGALSLATADILVAADASGANVVGMALSNVASGGKVAIQTQGLVVALAAGTVTASQPVAVVGTNAVVTAGSVTLVDGHYGIPLGRAWTSATSGGYCLVKLNL